jgi:hypothetical protein
MRRILMCAAGAILSVALAAPAQAGPKGGGGGHGSGGHGQGQHGSAGQWHGPNGSGHQGSGKAGAGKGHGSKPGVKSFKGKSGHQWGRKLFDKRYGCKVYFDTDSGCWCYWCPPDDCYYPVDYCPYGKYTWDDDDEG